MILAVRLTNTFSCKTIPQPHCPKFVKQNTYRAFQNCPRHIFRVSFAENRFHVKNMLYNYFNTQMVTSPNTMRRTTIQYDRILANGALLPADDEEQ